MTPQPIGPSDDELIVRARRGDTAAFGDLYERHLNTIYRYVLYRVSDVAEAEDLTETTFLKAWEALADYRLRDVPFNAWLYRIAHNVIVDQHRTRKETLSLDQHIEIRDETASPEDRLGWHESVESLTLALQQLPPAYQQVLALRFISGLSHAETGRVLGRSEEAVRVLQHRALSALRTLLDKTMNSDARKLDTGFS
jgi:RNA polymerase sigma-70 factor (ECF subfamily)